MSIERHTPVTTTAQAQAIEKLLYREGAPRNYRFDASTGRVNVNGEEQITKPGGEFSFIPVALRIFKDSLFNRARTTWAELFFLNQSGVMCSILAHGFTVENLVSMEKELMYDKLIVTECILTLKPESKTKKDDPASKYYIGTWASAPATREALDALQTLISGERIYRDDTIRPTACEVLGIGNFIPPMLSEGEPTAQLAADPQDHMIAEPEEFVEIQARAEK